jgi:molybdopterin/thiamine biosynthesis adenylyltransferase
MGVRERSSSVNRVRALVIGVGGLGCPAALALARAGVGMLGLVDPDTVDVSNLPRQLLYDDGDVGRAKIDVAAARLRAIAPELGIVARRARFTAGDAAWLRDFDVVVDGTDSIAAKFEVNDAAVLARVPLVHAGAVGWRAQLLTVVPGASACYRCVFEEAPPPDDVPSCQEAGVLGPVVALAGSLQAADALRVATGATPHFADRMLTIDMRAGTWRSVPVVRRPSCAACGGDRTCESDSTPPSAASSEP